MIKLQIEMIIASIILLLLIVVSLKKNTISIKSSIAWLLLPVVFLIIAIFPDPLTDFSHWLGFETFSNFIFVVVIALLIIICFFLTVTISHQQAKIIKLIQELAIVKKEQNDHKKTKK